MNKATLTGAMLGGLLMAMPLVQAQTPGPADPIDEQGPALSPPLDGGPGSSGEDPRRRGEDRGREGLPPDTDHDGVPDADMPGTEQLPGEDLDRKMDLDMEQS
ncbi:MULTISPECIES: hypothetical protein [Pseudomonas]|jgi:hypothetical protein|uniref:Uncharacterized protein n=1 Tax=Serpens gallinarum TaxID=2763075 RepID=A0ABR8TMG4_9PSED|nr:MULTISPECIES: hypothetical protein [Pseudomonas]MBD7976960.1 hypothetical protein [Serpens gallinarum]MBF0676618.1 hypothetical protein [Pseudomonas sp.]